MISALIIDDEPMARQTLREMLATHCPQVVIKGEATSVASGIELLNTTPTDLLFLDIHLTDGSGFELLDHFDQPDFRVIFTTAHDEFALKAFRYHAINYLLKPIVQEELIAAIRRIKPHTDSLQATTLQLAAMLNDLKTKEFKTISLSTQEGLHIIPLNDIIRLQSNANYTTFHTTEGESIMVARTIKEYEDLLPSNKFLRIHRSHIINFSHIRSIRKEEGGYLLSSDNTRLPIARRKKDALMEYFKNTSLR